jgi:peptidoglycan-N-acetylglucosamine deacetylase
LAAGRLAAASGALTLRGRARFASWLVHDFLWLYPTLRRNCDWHGEVVTRFSTTEREVCLTIDDGPDPRDTPEMLDLLARHQARAAFFVIGEKAERHRSLCRRILAEGHRLGNHTHSHPASRWWALPGPQVHREIARGNDTIMTATGTLPLWFRPPVGMCNFSVHRATRRNGLRVIGWSATGGDGCPAAPSQIVTRIHSGLQPGAIILLHESGSSPRRVLTLARLLETLTEDGYRCVLPPESSLL